MYTNGDHVTIDGREAEIVGELEGGYTVIFQDNGRGYFAYAEELSASTDAPSTTSDGCLVATLVPLAGVLAVVAELIRYLA